jgi:sugar-specific transcriptional regulator TrmB
MEKVKFFSSLGFGEYEAKALASLVKLKSGSPKEISFDSGVPQNKLYGILKDFERKGILALVPGESKRYRVINFETFVENRIKEKENELKSLKKSSKNLDKIKDNEDEFIFSLLKGQQTIMNKLAEQNIVVRKEIFGVQRNWKVWGKGIRAMKDSVKKGVDVRLIGVVNKDTKKKAREWKKIGCKIRGYSKKFGESPLRFTVFDNEVARITIGKPEISDPKDYVTIWTKSKPLIRILRNQFIQMWKECEKF